MNKVQESKKIPLQPMPTFTATGNRSREREVLSAIDGLNSRMPELTPGKSFTDEYLDMISKAATAAKGKNWLESYRNVWDATFLINRGIESQNNRRLAVQLSFAPFATFALLAIINLIATWDALPLSVQGILGSEYIQFLWTGAVGGTTIAWWGIVKHMISMDFDDQFKSWYWFKPVLGAVFGVISVIIIQGGMFTLADQSTSEAIKNPEILHVIAFLAGFSERFFVRMIDRVMNALFGAEGETPKTQVVTVPTLAVNQTNDVVDDDPDVEDDDDNPDAADKSETEHPGLP